MSTANGNRFPGMVGRLADWWQDLRAARMRLRELQQCGDNLEHIARDVGLSSSDLYAMAAKPADAADQHTQRLAALDIDRASLLRRHPRVAVWRTYCPNAQTLDALQAAATAAAQSPQN
jgi:hypothetical protein